MEEALAVYERYGDCPGLKAAHGYQHLLRVHRGEITMDEARNDISIMIRQYSKRQMTWLRSVPDMTWFTVDTMSQAEIIDNVLEMSQAECLKK